MSTAPEVQQPDLRSEPLGPAHIVALARSANRNALTDQFCTQIADELERVASLGTARAILLTADGGHFCVGGDLGWLHAMSIAADPSRVATGLAAFQRLIRTVTSLPLPVVALISGSAAGFGLDLALACDYRIAGFSAQLTSAFAKVGLVPDGGSSLTLPALLSRGAAFRFLTCGEVATAERALALGLVDEVVPDVDLLDAGMAFVQQLGAQPASSVSAIKQLLRRVDAAALDAALVAEGRAQVKAASGPDFAARAQAFLTRKKV